MRISYFYDIALPSRFAAAIQILNTCHALAGLGAEVAVYCGALESGGDEEGCLRFYGLAPHDRLRLVPLFDRAGGSLRARVRRVLVEGAAGGVPHVVISRGEPGLTLFRALRGLGDAPRAWRVFEAHRLCSTWLDESPAGPTALARWIRALRVARVRRLERAAIEGADGLICLTRGVRDALERSFRVRGPVLILPSGTSVAAHAPEAEDAAVPRDIDVLYVGKLERRKGVQDAVEAMRFLPGRVLWVVGGSAEEVAAFEALARKAGSGDRVRFTGYVEPTRVREYLARARVGICPLPTGINSVSESFTSPLKVLEMMAAGVPVVASDVPSIRESFEPDRHALLAPPDDPAALAGAIRSLLEDPALAERLRAAAREHVAGFSWEGRARRLMAFLERLVAGAPPGDDLDPDRGPSTRLVSDEARP